MGEKKNQGLFDDLKDLGFDNLNQVSIYNKNDKKEKESALQVKEERLYDRKITCPVCESKIKVRAVKSSYIRTLSRDTDLMINYDHPSPLLYDAWVCTECGYAALSSQFNAITYKQTKFIKEIISVNWKPKEYPHEFNINTAVERYKLALLNTIAKKGKNSEKALICLKIAWLYRINEDINNEEQLLNQALEGFESAYEKEIFPIAGMDESTLIYLIGELYRRLGDNQTALLWFSRVFTNKKSKKKIKDMAREQKYLINEQVKKNKKAENKEDIKIKKNRSFFAKLFNLN